MDGPPTAEAVPFQNIAGVCKQQSRRQFYWLYAGVETPASLRACNENSTSEAAVRRFVDSHS